MRGGAVRQGLRETTIMKMKADDLPLDIEMRRRFLERCPDLGGHVDTALAEKFELAKYDRDHTFYSFDDGVRERPLRIILLGHVSLVQRRGREQVTRSCGPMATFGEESVRAWNDERVGGRAPEVEAISAITKSVTYVLELPAARFPEVLGLPRGDADDPLLAGLLGAYDVHEIAAEIVETLGLRPELVEVDEEGLYQLLEGAEIRQVAAGEMLAPAGALPTAFFVLLDRANSFELRAPGKSDGPSDVSVVPAPACSGLAYVIKELPLEAAIHVQREGKVIALSADAFWSLFKFNTDFQRAIIRGNNLDVRAGSASGRRPTVDPSAANIFLMIPTIGLDVPMRGLTDLLAESIVTHLYDSVLVVHAVPKPRPGEPSTARPALRLPLSDRAWLEHYWVEIGDSLISDLFAGRARRAEEMGEDPARPDVTLIEISGLGDSRRFLREFDKIDFAFKVVHLTDRPDSLPPVAFIAAGASIVYTGLLDATPPVLGLGAAAHGAHGSTTQNAIDVTVSAAKNVGSFAKRVWQGYREARSVALGHLPPAWPLGTVRLRLSAGLLAALAPAPGKPPMRLADLGTALEKEARPTMERWARAVTTRRVGLALGGGGTYGDVHVPFIRALTDKGVPIDMVSGSSVGSTIGAYYCGLAIPGLDLYWKHRSLLLAAGSVGFISSAAVELAMTYDLGQLQLDQTDIPFFPVVTDADVGVESYLSKGTYAFGVRASGSLPPLLGPTVQGDRRYLDGGLVANVPVNVLAAEGAALIIASNPIARLAHRPRQQPFRLPIFGVLLRESNPLVRLDDAARMVPMIFGVAGQSQAASADVVYRPASTDSSLTASRSDDFEKKALASVLLRRAVAEVVNKWHASLGNPPARVKIVQRGGGRVLEVDGWLGFVGTSATIDPVSVPLLIEAAALLVERPEVLRVQVVVSSANRGSALKQAERIKALFEEHGVQPARVEAIGAEAPPRGVVAGDAEAAPEPTITFPVLSFEEAQEEQAKLRAALEEAKREMLEAGQRADAETLTLAAKDQAVSGDLDLAGLLAIEAAKRSQSPSLDEVLRLVLGRRGHMERSIAVPTGAEALCAAWSPDGDLLAVGSRDGLLRIWDARVARPEPLGTIDHRGGTDMAILGAAFSADGRRIAAAGFDGQASVHELIRGPANSLELKAILRRNVGTWNQWGVALSPDGARALVTWRARSSLAIFDLAASTPEPLHVLAGTSDCQHAAWEAGGERVAAAMNDGTAVIWSATTGAILETIVTGERGAVRVAWHPGGAALAVACDSTATIHDLRTTPAERSAPVVLDGHRRQIVDLAWSDDGTRLVTASKDLTARIWDAKSGVFQMSLRSLKGHFVGAAFRPGSVKVIATWDELGAVGVWSAETGEAQTILLGHLGSIRDARWSPDGARLATVSTDKTARIWAPEAIGQVAYAGHTESRKPRLCAAVFSPSNADQVVTASIDGSAHAWRPSDGAAIRVLTAKSLAAGPADVSYSPTGKLVAVTQARVAVPLLFTASDLGPALALAAPPATDEEPMIDPRQIRWSRDGSRLAVKRRRSVVVWSAVSGAVERVIESPRLVTSIGWSPSGDRLALALWTRGDAVELWDPTGDAPPSLRFGGCNDGVWSMDWSVGGRLATGSNDSVARVHDAATGAILAAIPHPSAVKVVALSPDGRWLATGDDAQTVAIWDWAAAGSKPVSGPSAHGSRIRQVTWSADGRRLLSTSDEGIVCLWERRDVGSTTTFVNVGTLQSAHCGFEVATTSPDGKWIVTGDDEGLALVHPVAQADLVAAVAHRLGRSALTDAEWTRYLPGRRAAPVATAPMAGVGPEKG
jgi:WD40 repeat protein/predicted acylesterase/phospholipase RssA